MSTSTIQKDDMIGFWKVLTIPERGTSILCLCTGCGQTQKLIYKWNLLKGLTKSCGCQSKKLQEETNVEKYGTKSSQQNPEIKEKSKQTLLEKYGVENYAQADERNEKAKQTCLEKYGVDHYSKTEEFKKRIRRKSYGKISYGQTFGGRKRQEEG